MAQTKNNDQGAFVPTTQLWDPSEIESLEISEDLKQLFVRMYQQLNRMALSVDVKDSGFYDVQEFLTGQQYFPKPGLDSTGTQFPDTRNVFRKVVNFGALPNTTTKDVVHGINIDDNVIFTRIYGVATDPVNHVYLPLPYSSSTAANNIELSCLTNGTPADVVRIITGSDRTAFTICYCVLEYLKF